MNFILIHLFIDDIYGYRQYITGLILSVFVDVEVYFEQSSRIILISP